jgi:tetratricopeptide (TPR) repeat protein
MHALLRTLLPCHIVILIWNCTFYTAAASETRPEPSAYLVLAQFAAPSGWPGTDASGKRSQSPSRRSARPANQKVPLPSRRPVIDAGPKNDTASSPAQSEDELRLSAQARWPKPERVAAITSSAEDAAGDDPAWLKCRGNAGSTEITGEVRVQACTEILARSPAEPAERRREALTLRASAYASINSDRTLGDYSALLELTPNDMQVLFLRSAYHIREQHYDLALADLDRIVAAQPANAKAFAERGRVHELKKDLNAAEKDYRKAAEIESGNPEYMSKLDDIAKLRSADAEKDKPKKSVVFGLEDAAYKSCANFSESPDKRIEACNTVIARLPVLEIESALFMAEKTEDLSDSANRMSIATGFDTTWLNIAAAIGLRGLAYAEKNDMESALVDINNAIDKAGRLIYRDGTASTLDRMMLRRGDLFMSIGEYERAEDDYRTVTRINLVSDAHSRLASLHFTRGRHDQAEEEIRTALRRNPKDGLAYSLRGRIRLAQRDYGKALEDCQRAVEIEPRSSPNARACVETARNALNGNPPPASPSKDPAKAE